MTTNHTRCCACLSCVEARTHQLQFWDPATKQYHPSSHQGDLTSDNARTVACGRAWRIACADRPLKPRYVAPRFAGSSRTIADVQGDYGDWAQSKGLPHITAFAGKPLTLGAFAGEVRRIDADEYFAVSVETET